MWISICLLQGAHVVGTDTYEVLGAEKSERGIRILIPLGSLEIIGCISNDLLACAQALAPETPFTTTPET